MEYRRIGNSSLKLSVVTFGAFVTGGWLWGGSDNKNAIEAIKTAFDLGVTSIDTAPVYGQGLSEKIVGEAIKGIPRDKVQILTKFGLRWDTKKGEYYFDSKDNQGNDIQLYKYSGKDGIIKECEDSLRRLDTDYIDLYQIHWPDSTTPIHESMEAVLKLKKDGKIREAGVCNYNSHQMKEAEEIVELASNQVPYSMARRSIENDVVPYCIKQNKGILAYSPLQQGLLTGKFESGYKFKKGDNRANSVYFKEENLRKVNKILDKLKPIAEEKKATLAQLVIKWTINQPGITIALVGARTPEQSTQNAMAADLKLSTEELDFIDNLVDELKLEV